MEGFPCGDKSDGGKIGIQRVLAGLAGADAARLYAVARNCANFFIPQRPPCRDRGRASSLEQDFSLVVHSFSSRGEALTGAQIGQKTASTIRGAGLANAAAVLDQAMAEGNPLGFRQHPHEIPLG